MALGSHTALYRKWALMDIKSKMKEIMQFFNDNADVIYEETGIAYHVMFKDENGGNFLQNAGGERIDMFLLLMHHIDALRRSGTPETMGIDSSNVLEWMIMLSTMYMQTLGSPEFMEMEKDDGFRSTITKIPKI
jgi:hypothetical protein